jgi:outer membrane immunogenic protein
MRKLLLGTALFALAASGPALAADIPAPEYKTPVVVPVSYSWTGCYIGVNGGGKWARDQGNVNPTPVVGGTPAVTVTAFAFPLNDTSGTWLAGGQVGCNWQAGQFVFGVEGDADGQSWSASRVVTAADIPIATPTVAPLFVPGDSFSVTSRWQASARARLGYAWDRVMLYGTGGVGFTSVQFNSNFIPFVGAAIFPAAVATDTQTLAGPTIGGGFEYAFSRNLSFGLEGRYTWYGSHTFNSGTVAAIALTPTTFIFTPVSTSLNLNTVEVTARLNWKFDWGTAPVVTRY